MAGPKAERKCVELSRLGKSGKFPGNCSRDFRRLVKRHAGDDLLQPLVVDVPVRTKTNTVEMKPQDVLLPHEVFAHLAQHPDEFDARVLGGSAAAAASYWRSQRKRPWYATHPAREAIEAGKRVAPLRVYGDDAEVRKGKSCLILTWSGSACAHVATRFSRFLIAAVPVSKTVEFQRAAELVYRVIAWSLTALLDGKYPSLDPDGEAWPEGSRRAQLAGTYLDPRGRSIAAIAEFMGDWKWLRECLSLDRNYNCNLLCHLCFARKDRPPFAYDFSLGAGWRCTIVGEHWRAQYHVLPAISGIPGFSLSMTVPDPMHTIHLGLCLVAIGSALRILIRRRRFGVFVGKWENVCRDSLQAAFARFAAFARKHKIRHSQQQFTPGMMNMTNKSTEFPEMKAKAHNAAVVTMWLTAEMRADPQATALERACMDGLSGVLSIMHAEPRTPQLSAVEAIAFFDFGQGHLLAYTHLAQEAQAAGKKLWPMRPKHHMFSHLVSGPQGCSGSS